MRYIWGLLFWIVAFGAFLAFLATIPSISEDWRVYRWLFLGMFAYLALTGITSTFFEQNLKFFRTFTHELTHTIFTILSLKNMLIILSPYCIPIFTIALLLLHPLFQTRFIPYIQFVVGLTYLYHLHTNWLQIGLRQTDITKYPLFTSFGFITLFHLLFLGIILLYYREGASALWNFPHTIFDKLKLAIQVFLNGGR